MSDFDNNHRSLGKRQLPTNSNAPRTYGKYDDNQVKKRDQKEQDTPSKIGNRETSDTVIETNFRKDQAGDFKNFPEINQKSIQTLISKGYNYLFPIQYNCFYPIFRREDIIARDLTGSGKTIAFGLPIVEYLRNNRLFKTGKVQSIILAPTRELAIQITNELSKLRHYPEEFKIVTVYGGVSVMDQANQLRNGVDLFVGTTGRVKDHIERGNIDFSALKSVVLDEADVMLKLGFKEDIEQILIKCREVCPTDLQICLFSATVPPWIKDVAREHMKQNFKVVDLCQDLTNKTSRTVKHLAIDCPFHDRMDALAKVLNFYGGQGRIIVFSSTKVDANACLLSDKITHDVEVMHGDIAQNQREVTIKRFKDAKFQVLVATDVAARGLDIPNVELVIQLEPPKDTESYIHRSGRTARAGKSGTCITFFNRKNQEFLERIESMAGIKLERVPVPSEEDMQKAKNKDVLKKLADVDYEVLQDFEEAAEIFLQQQNNDAKKALKIALAFLSGHTKQRLPTKSLLNGRDGFVTMKMNVTQGQLLDEASAMTILQKYWAPKISSSVSQMQNLRDGSGVCFDIKADSVEGFMDNYEYLKQTQSNRVDFECSRCKNLPDLEQNGGNSHADSSYSRRGGNGGDRGGYGGDRGGRGGRGGFGGDRGGYGGDRRDRSDRGYGESKKRDEREHGGWNGQNQNWKNEQANPVKFYNDFGDDKPILKKSQEQKYSQSTYEGASTAYSRNSDQVQKPKLYNERKIYNEDQTHQEAPSNNVIYVGNLRYDIDENQLMSFLSEQGYNPVRAKIIFDKETQKPKGCAFVQMKGAHEAESAVKNAHQSLFEGRQLVIRIANSNHAQ